MKKLLIAISQQNYKYIYNIENTIIYSKEVKIIRLVIPKIKKALKYLNTILNHNSIKDINDKFQLNTTKIYMCRLKKALACYYKNMIFLDYKQLLLGKYSIFKTIVHEFAHKISYIAAKDIPHWFGEGLAQIITKEDYKISRETYYPLLFIKLIKLHNLKRDFWFKPGYIHYKYFYSKIAVDILFAKIRLKGLFNILKKSRRIGFNKALYYYTNWSLQDIENKVSFIVNKYSIKYNKVDCVIASKCNGNIKAIGFYYDEEICTSARVVLRGKNETAEKILNMADTHKIRIFREKSSRLTNKIYYKVKNTLCPEIQSEFYKDVAHYLSVVYSEKKEQDQMKSSNKIKKPLSFVYSNEG